MERRGGFYFTHKIHLGNGICTFSLFAFSFFLPWVGPILKKGVKLYMRSTSFLFFECSKFPWNAILGRKSDNKLHMWWMRPPSFYSARAAGKQVGVVATSTPKLSVSVKGRYTITSLECVNVLYLRNNWMWVKHEVSVSFFNKRTFRGKAKTKRKRRFWQCAQLTLTLTSKKHKYSFIVA